MILFKSANKQSRTCVGKDQSCSAIGQNIFQHHVNSGSSINITHKEFPTTQIGIWLDFQLNLDMNCTALIKKTLFPFYIFHAYFWEGSDLLNAVQKPRIRETPTTGVRTRGKPVPHLKPVPSRTKRFEKSSIPSMTKLLTWHPPLKYTALDLAWVPTTILCNMFLHVRRPICVDY